MSAQAALRELAGKYHALAAFPREVARAAAPLVEEQSKLTAAAGTTPEGEAWPFKKDGSRALANAADHVTAGALDTFIVIELDGPDAFHNDGAQGKPVRRVIPDVDIPEPISDAIARGAEHAFDGIFGGA